MCGRSVGSTHPGHGQRGQRPPRWPRQRRSWKSCSVWCSTGAEKVGAGRDGEDPQGHDLVWGLYGLCRHLLYPFYTTLSRGGDICQAKTAELRTLPVPIWADGPSSAILVRSSPIGSLGSPGLSNGREDAPVPPGIPSGRETNVIPDLIYTTREILGEHGTAHWRGGDRMKICRGRRARCGSWPGIGPGGVWGNIGVASRGEICRAWVRTGVHSTPPLLERVMAGSSRGYLVSVNGRGRVRCRLGHVSRIRHGLTLVRHGEDERHNRNIVPSIFQA